MPPFIAGGDMIASVGRERSTWNALPWKFEGGTSMIAQVVGLGAAVDYLSLGMERPRARARADRAGARARWPLPGVRVLGPGELERRGGVISFVLDGIHPHDVAEVLGRHNVCVRASHHCAQPLMARFGLSSTARASFAPTARRATSTR